MSIKSRVRPTATRDTLRVCTVCYGDGMDEDDFTCPACDGSGIARWDEEHDFHPLVDKTATETRK